jgi:hypothetical protein
MNPRTPSAEARSGSAAGVGVALILRLIFADVLFVR